MMEKIQTAAPQPSVLGLKTIVKKNSLDTNYSLAHENNQNTTVRCQQHCCGKHTQWHATLFVDDEFPNPR